MGVATCSACGARVDRRNRRGLCRACWRAAPWHQKLGPRSELERDTLRQAVARLRAVAPELLDQVLLEAMPPGTLPPRYADAPNYICFAREGGGKLFLSPDSALAFVRTGQVLRIYTWDQVIELPAPGDDVLTATMDQVETQTMRLEGFVRVEGAGLLAWVFFGFLGPQAVWDSPDGVTKVDLWAGETRTQTVLLPGVAGEDVMRLALEDAERRRERLRKRLRRRPRTAPRKPKETPAESPGEVA